MKTPSSPSTTHPARTSASLRVAVLLTGTLVYDLFGLLMVWEPLLGRALPDGVFLVLGAGHVGLTVLAIMRPRWGWACVVVNALFLVGQLFIVAGLATSWVRVLGGEPSAPLRWLPQVSALAAFVAILAAVWASCGLARK